MKRLLCMRNLSKKNAESENDPARQIQSWGSMDEKTVKVLMEEIILKMGEDKYSFATYLNILHNFVALVSRYKDRRRKIYACK